jgi:transcriptional regulator with XRE-family HTH domain
VVSSREWQPPESPLRRARLRAGWTQAAAMRRFEEAVRGFGECAPTGASLKRMFAYWESGERAVTVETYRRAFVLIYQAPYEALGFAPSDGTGRIAALREGLELHAVDRELVSLFESQTQNLRMLDRRLGTAALLQQTEMHVTQMERVLQNSVGGRRIELAAALAAAAGLAGWQALDQGSIQRAWQLHDVARSAARESGNATLIAHVTAQSAYVLLDANQSNLALQRVQSAAQELGSKSPRLLSVWLAAAEAEAAAAVGDGDHAERQLDKAYALLPDGDDSGELPYLMLDKTHLARWRGHCLGRLGRLEAIDYLNVALERVGDSVRAATGLHVDLAHAYRQAGQLVEAREQVKTAGDMASRFGSRRQQNRLRALLPAAER